MSEQKIEGLTNQEVRQRRLAGQYNKQVTQPSKTVEEIVKSNVLTYFNFVFLFLAILLTLVGSFRDLTFLPLIIVNTLIGILQELRAKIVLDKLTIMNTPRAKVVREGREKTIPIEKLVLGDTIVLGAGNQIPADAVVIAGEVMVNEALLTGEADEVRKAKDSDLLSGSFVVSGECYAQLTKVGTEAYIAQLTLKAKEIKTGEQSEIIRSLNKIVKLAGVAIIPIGIILFIQGYFFSEAGIKESVQAMVAAILGMIPEGLFLLSSVTLALSAMRLAMSKVLLHDMRSIETLARVDVLCVDKTGTITDDTMEVDEVVPLDSKADVMGLMGDFVKVQKADTGTMTALKKYFGTGSGQKVGTVVGFSSRYKYSGVQLGEKAYVLGAPELVLGSGYTAKYRTRVEEYSKNGLRVVLLGEYAGKLDGEKLKGKVKALALVVLKNHVRESAPETFRYFAEQGVEVKVISGDNPLTVAEVARQAGIAGADKYVDASKLDSEKDLVAAVKKYTVFGRVTPEQKRKMVRVLQKAGRTVAMTGDGVNDILALKDADCSIAMASGSDAAVQAAQVVLLESDFAKMPSIVTEGRRVVNNLERSGSLFLVKNVFSFIMSVFAIIFSFTYPLIPTQLSLVTMWTIGVPSFFLAQIPNNKLIKGRFVDNVLSRAIPAGLTDVVILGLMVLAGVLFGFSANEVGVVCSLLMAVVGIIYLYRLCQPFDIWKRLIWWGSMLGMVFCTIFLQDLFGLSMELEWGPILVGVLLALLIWPVMKQMTRFLAWGRKKAFEVVLPRLIKYGQKLRRGGLRPLEEE